MTGNSSSCGCYLREIKKQQCLDRVTHGHCGRKTRSHAYVVWLNMIQRCTNPKLSSFKNYGGRGISVCDRWREFTNFLADMGEPPADLTLERKDTNGNYEKENCCWATRKQQMNNIRRNRILELNGERLTLQQWADRFGVNSKNLTKRIKAGWPLHLALTLPSPARPVKDRRAPISG